MDYSRIDTAKQNRPDLFPAGLADLCVMHDDWCRSFKGKRCNCSPDFVVTTAAGKFSVLTDGTCRMLGPIGETLPTMIDPRDNSQN